MTKRIVSEISPLVDSLVPYQPGKTTAEVRRTYGLTDVIKLASNECPLPPSPVVSAAIKNYLPEMARYPEDAAPEFRAELAEHNGVSAAQITFGAGSSEVAELLVRSFAKSGGKILAHEHCFYICHVLAKPVDMQVEEIAVDHWQQPLDTMLAAIDDDTRMIFVINPNNPTGDWLLADKLEAFIKQVPEHVLIVIDEAYHDYMDQVGYRSMVPMIKDYPNVAVLRTFSKAYAMAGLRFGYSITDAEIAERLNRLRKPFNVPEITLVAARAALADQDFVREHMAMNKQSRHELLTFFKEQRLKVINDSANFLTVEVGPKAQAIFETLMQRGVIVRPLAPYKMPTYLRVSVGLPNEMQLFYQQFIDVMQEYAVYD